MLKHATAYIDDVIPSMLFIEGPLGNAIWAVAHIPSTFPQQYEQFDGGYVFEALETIRFKADGQAWDVSSSGFLLTLP